VTECLACPLYSDTVGGGKSAFEDCICPELSTLDPEGLECQCDAGYYMDPDTDVCLGCPQGRFRSEIGGVNYISCTECPPDSTTAADNYAPTTRTDCLCDEFAVVQQVCLRSRARSTLFLLSRILLPNALSHTHTQHSCVSLRSTYSTHSHR
jgi:hypothetical protein